MNMFKTFMLMGILMAVLIAIGGVIGGSHGVLIAFIFSLGINFWAYWFSDKACLKAYGAKPIAREDAPNLYDLVEELATRANLPMPKVCIIESDEPNAFATGRNPEHAAVAITTGLTKILDYNEISGVISHELAHVKHRDILISSIAAAIAGAISTIANMLQFNAIFGANRDDEENSNPMIGIVIAIISTIISSLIQMAISRTREYSADAEGGNICKNPLYLANALNKIEMYAMRQHENVLEATPATAHMFIMNPISVESMKSLFRTHPETQKRIERLREQAYERGITTV